MKRIYSFLNVRVFHRIIFHCRSLKLRFYVLRLHYVLRKWKCVKKGTDKTIIYYVYCGGFLAHIFSAFYRLSIKFLNIYVEQWKFKKNKNYQTPTTVQILESFVKFHSSFFLLSILCDFLNPKDSFSLLIFILIFKEPFREFGCLNGTAYHRTFL